MPSVSLMPIIYEQHEEADGSIMEEEQGKMKAGDEKDSAAAARVFIGESTVDTFKAGLRLFPQKVTRWIEQVPALATAASL